MVEVIKYTFLSIWTLFCFIQISENCSKYNFLGWIIIIGFTFTPHIILFISYKNKRKKQQKHSMIPQNNVKTTYDKNFFVKQNELMGNDYNSQKIPNMGCMEISAKLIDDTSNQFIPEMKGTYTSIQMQNDIRILNDCLSIMQTTNNLETFFQRYELAMQKIYALNFAKSSGIKINISLTPDKIISLKENQKNSILQMSYNKELSEIGKLKTVHGKNNRIDKFLSFLSQYEDEYEFSDNYKDIISSLKLLKKQINN